MTREQITRELDFVDKVVQSHFNDPGEGTHRALQEAIKLIEQEPCEDCISRQEAIEQFIHWWSELLENEKEDETFDNILKALPSVTPQEPKTEWINGLIAKVLGEVDGGTDDRYIRYADICDRVEKSIREYCGAKMESEVEQERKQKCTKGNT